MSQFKNKLVLIYHWIAFLVTANFLRQTFALDPRRQFFDDFCQMTNVNMILIMMCYLIMVIYDMIILRSKMSPSDSFRYPEFVYVWFQTVFAISGLVTISYWGLRIYDQSLLFKDDDVKSSFILSSYTHGINWLLLWAEGFILPQMNHRNHFWKLVLYTIVVASYLSIQFSFWKTTGKYAYPFLAKFTLEMTIHFYLGLFILMFLIDRSGFWIHKRRWHKHPANLQNNHGKIKKVQ